MNKSKKIIILTLILSLLISCFPIISFADDTVAVSVGNVSGEYGDTVEVPIILSNNSGFMNLAIEIEYDSSALELVAVETNSSVGAVNVNSQYYSNVPYSMSWDSTNNIYFNGTLATMSFEIISEEAGEQIIGISYYKGRNGNYVDGEDANYDEDFNPLNLTYNSGKITIGNVSDEPEVVLPEGMYVATENVIGKPGEIIEVPIILSNNSGFSNLGIEIEYDTSVLTLTSVSNNTSVGATYTAAQTYSTYPYNMIWNSITNNTFEGVLATLTFTLSEDATSGKYEIGVSYYKGRNGDYIDGSDVNYDENFTSLNLAYVNGCINIEGETSIENSIKVSELNVESTELTGIVNLTSSEQISGTVIVAAYSESGQMLNLKLYDAVENFEITLDIESEISIIKVMWWSGLNTLIPKAELVKINYSEI